MRFVEFLSEAGKKAFWRNRTICFRGDSHALVFFRLLFDVLKEKEVVAARTLHVDTQMRLWQTLQQSFLGENYFYWLGDILDKIKIKKKRGLTEKAPDLIEILSLYRGPHSIAFFLPLEYNLSLSAQKRMTIVDLPNKFRFRDIVHILSFLECHLTPQKKAMLQAILAQAGGARGLNSSTGAQVEISLDLICMLSYYLAVTSVRLADSLQRNISTLVAPELALVDLSKSFFSLQEKTFFSLWSKRCNDYSTPFWVAYWSDQLWRAYYVVTFLKQNNFPAARRFAFRLPSSFLKHDWRYCSLEKLEHAFMMLYDIDFAFKTGSIFCAFDLFYCDYFLKNKKQTVVGLNPIDVFKINQTGY